MFVSRCILLPLKTVHSNRTELVWLDKIARLWKENVWKISISINEG
ncbi:hypothetical protein THOE12_50149 [Vibrio rotiferianus]|nr:hypothetical protein THOE12_50149 [Vibrio rotiferianus]